MVQWEREMNEQIADLIQEDFKERVAPEEFDTLWEPQDIEEDEDGQLDI